MAQAQPAESAEAAHAPRASTPEVVKSPVTRKKNSRTKPQFVQPAFFYPNYDATRPTVNPGVQPTDPETYLSPEDDVVASRGIPVFKPSMEEFADFEAYMNRVDHWGRCSGIVKVIPPKEWTQSLPPIERRTLQDLRIKNPIQQNMMGRAGLFRQNIIEKNKTHPLSIEDWFNKCHQPAFRGPGPKETDKAVARDSAEARAELKKWKEQKAAASKARREEREAKAAAKLRAAENATATTMEDTPILRGGQEAAPGTPTSATSGSATLVDDAGGPSLSKPAKPKAKDKDKSLDPNRPLEPFYADFDPASTWLPDNTKPEDWTPEACRDIERRFWKGVGIGEPSWYGADLKGTLFPDPKTPWNVAHLPNLLNRLSITKQLPGVNSPYLYFGMWRATFAWHVEDMDLFSINYIHFGAPKHWYAIPQAKSEAFERTLAGYFPSDAKQCDQFLRHKSFTVSPMRLANDNVKPNVLVQHQGEFVITYPRGYHAGFNMGFNCAESINFALDSWMELGRRAKVCECEEDSVRIDVEALIAENALVDAIQQERAEKVETLTPSKRPFGAERNGSESGSQRKRKPSRKALGDYDSPPPKIRLLPGMVDTERKSKPTKAAEPEVSRPCLFCPSLAVDDLMPVFNPTSAVVAQSRSSQKAFGIMAHETCARAIPEAYMEDVRVDDKVIACIMGTENIPKDRWNLKCSCCQGKVLPATGAKIQCTKGKCSRAFHVSCAIADQETSFKELEVETWEQLPREPDAPEWAKPKCQLVKTIQVELLCSLHNPAVKDAKKRQAAEALYKEVMALPMSSRIRVRASGGVFEVSLVETMPLTQKVRVVWDDRREMELDWNQIIFKPVTERKPLVNEYERPKAISFRAKHVEGPPAERALVSEPVQSRPNTAQRPQTYLPPVNIAQHYPDHHPSQQSYQLPPPVHYQQSSVREPHPAYRYSQPLHVHVHPPPQHHHYHPVPHQLAGSLPGQHGGHPYRPHHAVPMQYGYHSYSPYAPPHSGYQPAPEVQVYHRPREFGSWPPQQPPQQMSHQLSNAPSPLHFSHDTPPPHPLGSSQIDFNKVLLTPKLHEMLGRNSVLQEALSEIKRAQG